MSPRVTRLAKRRQASRDSYQRAVRVYDDLVDVLLRDSDRAQRQNFITVVSATLEAFRASVGKGGAR
jgi:hypothetical protein